MALEDFTDAAWIEVDPLGRMYKVTEQIVANDLTPSGGPRIYKDFGLDYFGGNFTFDFEFNIGTGSTFTGYFAILWLTTALRTYFSTSPFGVQVHWRNAEGLRFTVLANNWYTNVGIINQSRFVRSQIYWCTLEQSTSGGLGYGFIELRVYTNSARTTHIVGSPLRHEYTNEQGQYDLPDAWQYCYAIAVQDFGGGVIDTMRWRFDINVGAGDNIYDGANLRAGFIRNEVKRAFPRLEVERGYLRHLVERGFIRNEVKRGFKRKGIA